MTCEGRNLPPQLIARKLASSTAAHKGTATAASCGSPRNFASKLLDDLSFCTVMRIFLAGILGGIVMFVWTSIAHMALPLGEAGINEIPNESALLGAMQSSIGDKTGLYIFPGLGVGKDATREQKSEAMKQMQQRIAANPSGIMMYHPPGRQSCQCASAPITKSPVLPGALRC